MKSTIKTSRTAGQLEKMFRELNKHYYNGELPEPIITLKKTPSAYGHITTVKTWTVSTEQGTFATIFLRKTKDIASLKEILGHSDLKETLVYAHVLNESKQEGMQCFNCFAF